MGGFSAQRVGFLAVFLLSLPFRLVGVSVKAVFDLVTAIITLPVRLLRFTRGGVYPPP